MYSTDFEARKAIINKLGGDTVNLTNIFQCELVILALYGGDPSDVNNIFEADKKILTLLGGDASGLTSVFDARKAIITQLGGDASLVSSLISASEMELEYASIKEENPPYVTFTAEEAGSTIGLAKKFSSFTLEYSSDTENWTQMKTSPSITLANIGDKVYVRGKLTGNLNLFSYTLFKMTGKIAASGSCNALWNYEDPEAQLRNHCGRYMFKGCTSLTKAPDLTATTLVSNCYYEMFNGCTNLTSIKCLATNISTSGALTNWTNGVASSGVFYKLLGVEWPTGTAGIPSGWEVKTVGHTITFANWDGTILQTTNIADGKIPVYNGSTPIRPFDDQYYYVFNGWSPAITEVTRDITYIALYTQIQIPVGNYVTFIAEEAGSTIGLAKLGSAHTLKYSTDEQSWIAMTTDTSIALSNIGDKVYVRGILSAGQTNGDYTLFKMTGKIAANGNSNALWNCQDLEAPLKVYSGYHMFLDCTGLTVAPSLPITTLTEYCYGYMFSGCKSLTQAPELSATVLVKSCYSNMFLGCTSLTQAPELPATTLADYCYQGMFSGCTSLTQASNLPATTLTNYCYDYMFSGCESLTQTPSLPITTLTSCCYRSMFNGCTSLTQAPELPATTLAGSCYSNMFNGCTSLTQAPELPATTLASGCYDYMFRGCTSLTQAPELPATTLASSCYSYMFKGCTSLTQAPELSATTLVNNCYYEMFYGCINLSSIKCLATDISASNSRWMWTYGVASSGVFYKAPGVEWPTDEFGIPSGWTVVEL